MDSVGYFGGKGGKVNKHWLVFFIIARMHGLWVLKCRKVDLMGTLPLFGVEGIFLGYLRT